jgi:hypothetical protein
MKPIRGILLLRGGKMDTRQHKSNHQKNGFHAPFLSRFRTDCPEGFWRTLSDL